MTIELLFILCWLTAHLRMGGVAALVSRNRS